MFYNTCHRPQYLHILYFSVLTLSQVTIRLQDVQVYLYLYMSRVTILHVMYLSVLILVTSLVSSVLVLVTGHDTCILSHLLYHHHHHSRLNLPPKSDSQNGQSLDFTLRLSSELSEIFKGCNRQSHSVISPRDTHSPPGSSAWNWNKLNCCLSWSGQRERVVI